jgi:hypothetical protein
MSTNIGLDRDRHVRCVDKLAKLTEAEQPINEAAQTMGKYHSVKHS